METIGLIAAMPQERDAVLRCIQGWKRISLGPFQGHWFERSGLTCIMITSGVGVRRAGEAVRTLIETNLPGFLISFGIAGAVEAEMQVGDVIVAKAVCPLEEGLPGRCLPLATWPEAARGAAARVLSSRGARLLAGTAVTTRGSRVRENQVGSLLHPVLELETAGIARVAAEKGIPLFSLRAISDGPQAPIPFDVGEMLDADDHLNGGKILRAIARQPRLVLQSGQFMRNTRIAADNAAAALLAALSQMRFDKSAQPPG